MKRIIVKNVDDRLFLAFHKKHVRIDAIVDNMGTTFLIDKKELMEILKIKEDETDDASEKI